MKRVKCYHCGTKTPVEESHQDIPVFCCAGCETVYQIIHEHQLDFFYTYYPQKGVAPKKKKSYAFLADETLWAHWVQFKESGKVRVALSIPNIHCSACVWLLEHLHHIEEGVLHSHVNFSKRMLHVVFDESLCTLEKLALLLDRMGYPPDFSLGAQKKVRKQKSKQSLWLKIGIAGFAFGNTMFLALPTYFEKSEPWLDALRPWFDTLMFTLSIPVVFYAAQHYFVQSFKSIQQRIWSLDIPIALGISVLFLKSIHAAFIAHELPYFDSLTGLVFFLLLGQFMQQSVYASTDFEHEYASFFPLGVTLIRADKTETITSIEHIKKGDVMLLRPEEIIPVDGVIHQGEAHIDYSFVTGESKSVLKKKGEWVFAGGRIKERIAFVKAEKVMDESFLLQLWQQDLADKQQKEHPSFANKISYYFTPIILTISMISGGFWWFLDPSRAVEVVVAVLIVACPCALALSSPFIMGHMVRYFGKMGLLLKNNASIEKIVNTQHWVYDKTGTLTDANQMKVEFYGSTSLSVAEKQIIRSMVYQSSHPLSKALFGHLHDVLWSRSLDCSHIIGKGIEVQVDSVKYKIGSAAFAQASRSQHSETAIHINIGNRYRGYYYVRQQFRPHLSQLFHHAPVDALSIVSGDTAKDMEMLVCFISENTSMHFEQSPFDKVIYVKSLQEKGEKVLMLGDGLNDAGALIQSDAGIAVRDGTNMFTPRCDAILAAEQVVALPTFYWGMQKSIRLVYVSFIFSLIYNILGIGIAVSGNLTPIIAAILMPLSSMSVVGFAALSTAQLNKKIKKKMQN